MIEDVDYTASGYIQAIAPDGTVISRHRQEREAQQACFQHAKDNEDLLGDGVHDYILRSPDVRMSIRLLSVGGNPTNEDTTPPDPPAGVFNSSVTSSGFVTSWTNGPESDLQEHNVYRSSTGPSSGFSLVGTVTVPTASYSHTGLAAGTQYWVYVTALDSSGNESAASSVVDSTTTAATSAPYDLYATDTNSRGVIPFAVNWPTAPTITSEVTVSTLAGLQSALASWANGQRIVVQPGTYALNNFGIITGTDKHLQFQPGASITGGGNDIGTIGNCQRLIIEGGSFDAPFTVYGNTPTVGSFGATDILFKNSTFVGANGDGGFLFWDLTRTAMVGCEVSFNGYNVFLLSGTGGGGHEDFIVAGNYVHPQPRNPTGGAGAFRLNGAKGRIIFVDNLLSHDDSGSSVNEFNACRVTFDTSQSWFRNNQMEGRGTQGLTFSPNYENPGQGTSSGDIWLYDNALYAGDVNLPAITTYLDNSLTADGNTVYSANWNGENNSGQCFSPATGIGNNPVLGAWWPTPYPSYSPWT